jgi:hypothetical protein
MIWEAIPLVGLMLAMAGLAGLLAGWLTSSRLFICRRGLLIASLLTGLFVLISCCQCMVWDGRYPQCEFQLVFRDRNGNPLEGVQLRVEDRDGRNYFHYPVNDYVPGQIPSSDPHGRIIFHHVSGGIEFSGRTNYVLFVIPVEKRPAPKFLCRFFYEGREIYRVPFRELCWWEGTWNEVPKVTRRWKWPPWLDSALLPRPGERWEEGHARLVRLFDLNGNGKLDPEEAAAYHAFEWRADRRLGKVPETEEVEFAVVHRTISVELPSTVASR